MANHKSARKRVRSDLKKAQVNKRLKTSARNCEKKLRNFISKKEKEQAQKTLKTLFSILDRSAKVGTYHKNKSNRKKSRYSAQVHQIG